MNESQKFKRQYLIGLLPAGIILAWAASFDPQWVERYYSTGFYRTVGTGLSKATGQVPFSLAELGLIAVVLLVVWWLARLLSVLFFKNHSGRAGRMLIDFLIVLSTVYFSFLLLWGFNYYRLPFAAIAHLKVEPASPPYLAGVCGELIERTNLLRLRVHEDESGRIKLADSNERIFANSVLGYHAAGTSYPELANEYGRPKSINLQESMSYAGLSGAYCPFTGEANVDGGIPDAELPFTVCHEMAHQRGYAREDEANYIAYLTCNKNPDPDFKYSGSLLAVIHAMGMLQKYDPESYQRLQTRYSPGVKRDLAGMQKYWRDHQNRVWNLTDRINDYYLKANGQTEGVYSYNRMVDLLIAEHRAGIKY